MFCFILLFCVLDSWSRRCQGGMHCTHTYPSLTVESEGVLAPCLLSFTKMLWRDISFHWGTMKSHLMKWNVVHPPHFSVRENRGQDKFNGLSRAIQWHLSLQSVPNPLLVKDRAQVTGLQTRTLFHCQCWHDPSERGSWESDKEKATLPSRAGVSTFATRLVILTQMAKYLLAAFIHLLDPCQWSGSWEVAHVYGTAAPQPLRRWAAEILSCFPGLWVVLQLFLLSRFLKEIS